MSLSKKDLAILTKAAATLPRNAPGRELLASLTKKEASDEIKPFTRNDHMSYAGAESWNQGTPGEVHPFIAVLSGITLPWALVVKAARSSYVVEDMTPTDKWDASLVGDSTGVFLSLSASEDYQGDDIDFQFDAEAVPEEIVGLMRGAIPTLRSGKIPPWLKAQ